MIIYLERLDPRDHSLRFVGHAVFADPPGGNPADYDQSPESDSIRRWFRDWLREGQYARVTIHVNEDPMRDPAEDPAHIFTVRRHELGHVEACEPPAPVPIKRCSRCGDRDFANEENFYPRGDGWSSWCRSCTREYQRTRRDIKLHGRRFGVEIEFVLRDPEGSACDNPDCDECNGGAIDPEIVVEHLAMAGIVCHNEGYTHEVIEDAWKIVSDSSVDYGWELVSPPMRMSDWFQIETVCRVLKRLDAVADYSCGLHVHHEVRDLGAPAFKRLYRNWADWQGYHDSLVSPSRRDTQWCQHVPESEVENVQSITNLRDLSSCYLERYRSLNATCYPTYGTVEIRQHQGTLNSDKIRAWIAYGQAVIAASLKPGGLTGQRPAHIEDYLDRLPIEPPQYRDFLKRRAAELSHA